MASNPQQDFGSHTHTHSHPPRSYHDLTSPSDLPQGPPSHANQGIRQIDSNPTNFAPYITDIHGQTSGPNFHPSGESQRMSANSSMFSHYPCGGGQYLPEMRMQDMGLALDNTQFSMMGHSSPGSDGSGWDDNESNLSSPSPPESFRVNPLPSHEETENHLRQNLRIFAPRPVNLTVLPDEPFGTKPPKITDMIKLAIWGSRNKKLTLRQIYDAIEDRYPSWKAAKDKPWQRSIRHNLSLKAVFVREERPVNHPGKGCYWVLDVRQGDGNKRDRKRKDTGGRARSSGTSDDDDEDLDRNQDTSTRGPQAFYTPPQYGLYSTSPLALPNPAAYFSPQTGSQMSQPAFDPRISQQGMYSAPMPNMGPNVRWADPSNFSQQMQQSHLPAMGAPGMQGMNRAIPYPTYLPPNIEYNPPTRGGMPHPYQAGMPMHQVTPLSAPQTRSRRPHSEISHDEDVEEMARTARRHRSGP